MAAFTKTILTDAITVLSEKYGFSIDEATRTIGLDDISVKKAPIKRARKTSEESEPKPKKAPKAKVVKPKFALPWTGDVNPSLCKGIKSNNFLFTQCSSNPETDGERYCKTCQKQANENSNGKPSGGTVEDRLAVSPLDYVGPKDKVKVFPYGNFLQKKGISRENAIAEAAKFGIEIPEYQFVVQERKRGRPKKNDTTAAASDTSSGSETDATQEKKPKKKTTKKKEPSDDEMFQAMQEKKKVLKKKKEKPVEKKEKPVEKKEKPVEKKEKPVEKKEKPVDEKREKMAKAAAARVEAAKNVEPVEDTKNSDEKETGLKPFKCSKTGKTYLVDKDDNIFQEGNDEPIGIRKKSLRGLDKYTAIIKKLEEESEEEESEEEIVESEEEESEEEIVELDGELELTDIEVCE